MSRNVTLRSKGSLRSFPAKTPSCMQLMPSAKTLYIYSIMVNTMQHPGEPCLPSASSMISSILNSSPVLSAGTIAEIQEAKVRTKEMQLGGHGVGRLLSFVAREKNVVLEVRKKHLRRTTHSEELLSAILYGGKAEHYERSDNNDSPSRGFHLHLGAGEGGDFWSPKKGESQKELKLKSKKRAEEHYKARKDRLDRSESDGGSSVLKRLGRRMSFDGVRRMSFEGVSLINGVRKASIDGVRRLSIGNARRMSLEGARKLTKSFARSDKNSRENNNQNEVAAMGKMKNDGGVVRKGKVSRKSKLSMPSMSRLSRRSGREVPPVEEDDMRGSREIVKKTPNKGGGDNNSSDERNSRRLSGAQPEVAVSHPPVVVSMPDAEHDNAAVSPLSTVHNNLQKQPTQIVGQSLDHEGKTQKTAAPIYCPPIPTSQGFTSTVSKTISSISNSLVRKKKGPFSYREEGIRARALWQDTSSEEFIRNFVMGCVIMGCVNYVKKSRKDWRNGLEDSESDQRSPSKRLEVPSSPLHVDLVRPKGSETSIRSLYASSPKHSLSVQFNESHASKGAIEGQEDWTSIVTRVYRTPPTKAVKKEAEPVPQVQEEEIERVVAPSRLRYTWVERKTWLDDAVNMANANYGGGDGGRGPPLPNILKQKVLSRPDLLSDAAKSGELWSKKRLLRAKQFSSLMENADLVAEHVNGKLFGKG